MDVQSEFEVDLVRFEVLVDEFPINDTVEVLEVSSSGISVVDVVGVFPDINSKERLVVAGKGISGIRGVDDSNVILILGEPSPA
jgi:hypothetical protein